MHTRTIGQDFLIFMLLAGAGGGLLDLREAGARVKEECSKKLF